MRALSLVIHISHAVIAAVLCTASALPAFGQGFGGVLRSRAVEVGIGAQDFRRTIRYDDGIVEHVDWGRNAAFARVGLTDWLIGSVDGLIWHDGATDEFPNRDYTSVSAGVGLSAKVVRRGTIHVSVAARYHDHARIDQSELHYDKRTTHLTAALIVEHRVRLAGHAVDLWLAPAYVLDRLIQYPPAFPALRARSLNNWGALVGGSFLLGGHLRGFAQWRHTGAWQSEFGLAVLL